MSGAISITPAAFLDLEMRLARKISLEEWCAQNAVSAEMLEKALCGVDPYGIRQMLADELGVSAEALPTAA